MPKVPRELVCVCVKGWVMSKVPRESVGDV